MDMIHTDVSTSRQEWLAAFVAVNCATEVRHREDEAVAALYCAEDAILTGADTGVPAVILRASVCLRRHATAVGAVPEQVAEALDLAGTVIECQDLAIAALLAIAEQHRAAILAGNCDHEPDGTPIRATLDPSREAEVQSIEAEIAFGRWAGASISASPAYWARERS